MAASYLGSKWPALAALAGTLAFAAVAWAFPAYQDALFTRYPNAASSLQGCVACHDGGPGGALNPYGNAFLANGFTLNATLDALDSDNDGATNGAELGASPATAPGDPRSKPGASSPPVPSPPSPPSAPSPPSSPAGTDGPSLYANNCEACHGALASSAKAGATLARMQGAISGNIGGMGYLSSLSATQLQAIESALAPAAASSSSNYTGNWWNPGESGWGIYVNHQGNIAFATLFTYDGNGRPMWAMMSGLLQADGRTYAGDLQQVTGPPFNAQPFTPITGANVFRVGTMSLTFSSERSATLSYTYQGIAVSKAIVPLVFGQAAASCSNTERQSGSPHELPGHLVEPCGVRLGRQHHPPEQHPLRDFDDLRPRWQQRVVVHVARIAAVRRDVSGRPVPGHRPGLQRAALHFDHKRQPRQGGHNAVRLHRRHYGHHRLHGQWRFSIQADHAAGVREPRSRLLVPSAGSGDPADWTARRSTRTTAQPATERLRARPRPARR